MTKGIVLGPLLTCLFGGRMKVDQFYLCGANKLGKPLERGIQVLSGSQQWLHPFWEAKKNWEKGESEEITWLPLGLIPPLTLPLTFPINIHSSTPCPRVSPRAQAGS